MILRVQQYVEAAEGVLRVQEFPDLSYARGRQLGAIDMTMLVLGFGQVFVLLWKSHVVLEKWLENLVGDAITELTGIQLAQRPQERLQQL